MIKTKFLNHHLLLLLTTITTLYSSFPNFSTAQTNNNTRNPCDVHAQCGAFSSCNPQDTPICKCLHGFVPINNQKWDWDSGNWTGGCERRVPLNCDANNRSSGNKQDGFLRIEMVKVPGYQQHLFGPEDQCAGLCLMNCSCIAYAHDNDLGCMFWNGTLFDIQRFHSGLSSDLHFRVANSVLVQKKGLKKIIISMGIVGLLLSIFVYFSWKWMCKRRAKERKSSHGKEQSVDSSFQDVLNKFNLEELPLFKVETLANATDNFSDENTLGKGGFGPVFKGVLENGKEIAVKRLSKASGQGMQEFTNEVVLISKLQHRNLVRLLGCCLEDKEKMLVYEYMPNKSLDFFLFDQSQEILDWKRRFNIIEGICRGLLYLHRDSRLKIIHRDLKPSNILLDNDWNPKISDFGMARIFGAKQDHVNTVRVVGTYGYMAPEYAINGRFSEKSDVFSLGVLTLEIISGKKNTGFYDHESSMNLLGHVWKLWIADNVAASVDERISSLSYREEVVRCIHIGLLCVQELPTDRPSVSGVLSMLSSEIAELPKPKKVAFVPIRPSRSDIGTSSQQSQKSSCSLNSVTLTMVDGR